MDRFVFDVPVELEPDVGGHVPEPEQAAGAVAVGAADRVSARARRHALGARGAALGQGPGGR